MIPRRRRDFQARGEIRPTSGTTRWHVHRLAGCPVVVARVLPSRRKSCPLLVRRRRPASSRGKGSADAHPRRRERQPSYRPDRRRGTQRTAAESRRRPQPNGYGESSQRHANISDLCSSKRQSAFPLNHPSDYGLIDHPLGQPCRKIRSSRCRWISTFSSVK
jgi:hypothetical protein